MLTPEAMQRTLIVSSKSFQPAVIEALHELRAAHLVEYEERREGEFSEFRLGQPLPAAGPASERLVRVRALTRHLGVEGSLPTRTLAASDVEHRLERELDTVERQVSLAVDARDQLRGSLAEGRELEAKLAPLTALPLKLEDYRGYDTLAVFVGRADPGFENEVAALAPDRLLVTGGETLFALFVPKAKAEQVVEVLYRHGYAEVEVPEGNGNPAEKIAQIQADRSTLDARLAKADAEIARLANEHRDVLLAAEEHLSILVEKAEAPLAFASTDHAFVVDAWVPAGDYERVASAIERATNGNAYVAKLDVDLHAHAHDDAHHAPAPHAVDAQSHAHNAKPPKSQPPTKYANPKGVARFQGFVDLFSTPRYGEVDPTLVFAIAFPLFFGFMIGDLGLGLLMVLLGWPLVTKLKRVELMKELGTALLVAGVIAMIFGGFVFKDALGIPLGVNAHMEEELSAEGLALTCQNVYDHVHEATWGCLLGQGTVHAEPIIYKVSDVKTMLLLSVAAAGVHLLIGMLIGIKNQVGHGAKHLGAKVGFLILLLGFYPAVLALLDGPLFGLTKTQAYEIAGGAFLVGAVILGWAEGFAGILEIPSILSAILSYLRLGAVAIAKGAMAVAFNALTLVAIGLAGAPGAAMLVLGLVAFVAVQALLFVLGLLSAGIQALRLNFVEFFTKFYQGGGTPFRPFGRVRQVTTATNSPSTQ